MKRLIAAGMALLLLTCMVAASAGTPGSSSDPLVSRSYIDGAFTTTLKTEGAEVSGAKLRDAYNSALSKLDEIYKSSAGYRFASSFTELGLAAGKNVTLTTGASFILLSGSASLSVTGGSVVNVSTGNVVSPGSLLTLNQRYFCTEGATAVITVSVASSGFVDGYFSTDGVINPNSTVFKDVRRADWFYSAVDLVYERGLFAGTSDNTFSPATPMTRAMFVTVLYRLAGKPSANVTNSFTDVGNAAEYYYDPVSWANENGIVTGYEDGTFLPGRSITREQMALIMYRYAEFAGFDMTASGAVYDGFPDRAGVSPYAVEAMRWAVSQGIINGSDGKLLPSATATRAQVAQIIYNFYQKLTP